jgi:riboflavin transporter FmnP
MSEEVIAQEQARVVKPSNKRISIKVAGAAIFGAVSIVVSFLTTSILPRVPGWGIAYFDPVSIIWVMAFLIFGFETGLLTCLIGTIGLMPFDPTGIGPVMKFLATIWMVIIPYLYIKIKDKSFSGKLLFNRRNYSIGMVLACLIRIGVMIIANILIIVYYYDISFTAINQGVLGGWTGIFTTVIGLNVLQAFFDATISYFIVYRGKIYSLYEFY